MEETWNKTGRSEIPTHQKVSEEFSKTPASFCEQPIQTCDLTSTCAKQNECYIAARRMASACPTRSHEASLQAFLIAHRLGQFDLASNYLLALKNTASSKLISLPQETLNAPWQANRLSLENKLQYYALYQ